MRIKVYIFSVSVLCFSCFLPNASAANDATPLELALALEPDTGKGEQTYKLCAACHGADGLGQQNGTFPSIAGQHKSVIIKQLFDIQSKKRINPSMFPFSDMQTLGGIQGMADVSAYIATLTASTDHEIGNTDQLETGQQLYRSNCLSCHGEQGQGNAEMFYPRLRLQHFPYLVKEMKWIRDKVRANANPEMAQILQAFSDQEIEAVADYLSRLP